MRDIFIFGSSSEQAGSSSEAGSSSAIEHAGSKTAIARQVTQTRRTLLEEGLELLHRSGAQPQTSEQSTLQHQRETELIAEADESILKAELLDRITRLTKMFKATTDARVGERVGERLKLEIEKYLKILGTKMEQLENEKKVKMQELEKEVQSHNKKEVQSHKKKSRNKKPGKTKELEKQIGDTEIQLTELRKQSEKFEENKEELETLLQLIQMKKA